MPRKTLRSERNRLGLERKTLRPEPKHFSKQRKRMGVGRDNWPVGSPGAEQDVMRKRGECRFLNREEEKSPLVIWKFDGVAIHLGVIKPNVLLHDNKTPSIHCRPPGRA